MTSPVAHCLSLVRLTAYLGFTLCLIPLQALAVARNWRLAVSLPLFYHRHTATLLGLRVEIRGRQLRDEPVLFVANHASYTDMEVLGSMIPASFIAKAEVGTWPLFGLLARLQRTVFINRRARDAVEQRDSLAQRLQERGNLILFPEGTSNDSLHVRPFKSALFAAAEVRIDGRALAVQPVSVAYTRLNGIPIGRDFRPFFAWYGDMQLVGHLWRMIGFGTVDVIVQFYPPVTLDQFGSRKRLADHCWRIISDGAAAANAGRLPATEAMPQPVERDTLIGAVAATRPH
ncbi:MAG: lysophospholipid acyltransferase family protein [Aliidongia sp.]